MGAGFALRLGEWMFQTGSQKCNMPFNHLLFGVAPNLVFLFHMFGLVPSQQVFLQARKTVIAWAFGTVKSLFSEKAAFLAPVWVLGSACVWPVCGFPSTDGRAATARGQTHSWGLRESQTGVALGSVNCQDVWINWLWPGHHYLKWVRDVSRLFIKIIGKRREG